MNEIEKALDISMGRLQPALDVHHHIIYDNKDQEVAKLIEFSTRIQLPIGGKTRYLPKNHPSVYYGDSVGAVQHCIVGKSAISKRDISFASIVDELIADSKRFKKIIRLLGLIIHGYDFDPRPLWEIDEVRSWYAVLNKKYPYLLYWLHPEDIFIYVAMFGKTIRVNESESTIDGPSIAPFIESVWDAGNEMCSIISEGDDQATKKMMEEATARIMRSNLFSNPKEQI